MSKKNTWEDIFQEKLEDFERSLPADDWSAFETKLEHYNKGKKVKRILWAMAPISAVAACAAIAFIHPTGSIDVVPTASNEPSAIVADALDNEEVMEAVMEVLPEKEASMIGFRTMASAPVQSEETEQSHEEGHISEDAPAIVTLDEEEPVTIDQNAANDCELPEEKAPVTAPHYEQSSVTIPLSKDKLGTKKLHVGRVAIPVTAVAGAGALYANGGDMMAKADCSPDYYLPSDDSYASSTNPGSSIGTDANIVEVVAQDKLLHAEHHMPLVLGLSVRQPIINERLSLVTGIDYSRYRSEYQYTQSGTKTQTAQYIGIPLRLDYHIAQLWKFGLYAGAGSKVDWCLSSSLDEVSMGRDKASLSLLAASGIQFDFTRRLSFYVEPTLSYRVLGKNADLATYSSNRDGLIFTVGSGIRINL